MQHGYRVERADEVKQRLAEYHERVAKNPSMESFSSVDTTFVVAQRVPLDGMPNNFHVSEYRCEMIEGFGVRVI